MIPGISELYDTDAANVGASLLARASDLAPPPAGASAVAAYAAAAFPAVLSEARAAQDALVAAIAGVTIAGAQHAQRVAAAQAEERLLDAACAAIRDRLTGEVKEGTDGAQALVELLFPGGSYRITRLEGRPQLGRYQALLAVAASPTVTANAAYGAISARVESFSARVGSFAATIQDKDRLAAALSDARAARDQAQATWTAAFRDLIDTAARVQGEDSLPFRAWVQPLLEWKATQAAARTRRAQAAPAGDSAE